MQTMVAMVADALGRMLAEDFRRSFGSAHVEHAERLDAMARLAMESWWVTISWSVIGSRQARAQLTPLLRLPSELLCVSNMRVAVSPAGSDRHTHEFEITYSWICGTSRCSS